MATNSSLGSAGSNTKNYLNSKYTDSQISFGGGWDLADHLGYKSGIPGANTNKVGGEDLSVEDLSIFGKADVGYMNVRRKQYPNIHPSSLCNTFVVIDPAISIFGMYENTGIYKNGQQIGTVGYLQGFSPSGLAQGDIISADFPISVFSSDRGDLSSVYMGWAGYAFAHRRDRNTNAYLHVVAIESGTSVEIRTTGLTTGVSTSTSLLTSWTTTSGMQRNGGPLTADKHYYVVADKPVACFVRLEAGSGTNDTLPLYPMDDDDKFGFFSANGHVLATLPASQTSGRSTAYYQIQDKRSDNNIYNLTTGTTTSLDSVKMMNNTVSSGTFMTGPATKLESSEGTLFTAEQQGDGNGSEMTPFVGRMAMGRSTVIPQNASYISCIAEAAGQVTIYDQGGNPIANISVTSGGGNGVYFGRINNIPGPVLLTAPFDFQAWWDTEGLTDENVAIMASEEISPRP